VLVVTVKKYLQLTVVMNDADNHGNVLSGHNVLTRRSAVVVCACVFSNMPDSVLESQLTVVMHDPDNHDNVLSGYDVLARRSAVFVDLYDAAHYGTRSVLLYVFIIL